MMNLQKFIRITAFAVVLIFSTGLCFAQSVKTVNSVDELKDYLESQPSNTADKPIRVKITVNDLMSKGVVDAIKATGRYVSLDLSDSALKTFPLNAFKGCNTLALITMPNTLTSIRDDAFNGCTGLTSVTIANNVKSVGEDAFTGCTRLAVLNISAANIESSAFSGCTSLTKLNIGSDGKNISIGSNAFASCTGLTSVAIPDSVESIGSNAFIGCTGLTSVTISDSVKSIGGYAFQDCTNLTSEIIGKGVTKIGNGVFSGCTKLTTINVAADNKAYSSQDSVLYNKNKTELITYPAGKKGAFTVPSSVNRIWGWSFSGCIGLPSITLGNGVTSIMEGTFYNCTNLATVDIGASVTSIEKYAFRGCNNINNVTFASIVPSDKFNSEAFAGAAGRNLRDKYIAASGGRGTYTRANGATTWTKQ
jgi:hypothetical protein